MTDLRVYSPKSKSSPRLASDLSFVEDLKANAPIMEIMTS